MSEVTIEAFNSDKHYAEVSNWWKAESWPVVPLDCLSKTGIVVLSDGTPAAAGWVYKTDSSFCLLEFIVANPEVRREKRSLALTTLLDVSKKVATEFGFRSMFTSVHNESLGKRLEQGGFIATDRNMTNYICNVGRSI